jgi:hypothetical protein
VAGRALQNLPICGGRGNISERETKAKLNLAWWNHRGCYPSSTGVTNQRSWYTQILNVENVKELHTERQHRRFGKWEVLEQREVRIIYRGRSQHVSSEVAVGERWNRERARIEPLLRRSMRWLRVSNEGRPAVSKKCHRIADVSDVARHRQVIWLAGAQLYDPVYLPVAQ